MASDEEKQLAFTHLAQGKRHLLVKDYFEAVSSLASACECLAKIYGDDANECGDAYFNYGKALLELARSENGVLGNAVEEEIQSGDDEEESDEEEADAENDKKESEVKPDQNGNASTEHPDTSTTTSIETGDGKLEEGGGDADGINPPDQKKGDANELTTNGQNGSQEPIAEKDGDGEADGEVSNLNLAWEILELAKTIFQRQSESDKTIELKLAEVHLLLGEVGLESENFTEGTDDMLICLELQQKNLEPDNRRIAETYYQIGMGYGMANRFDDAIEAYTNCGKVLKQRVANLKNMVKEGIKPEGDDPFYSFEGEIKDLEELFPEINEKMLDMKDFKNETKKAMLSASMKKEASDAGAGSSQEPTFPDSSTTFENVSSTFTSSGSSSTVAAKPISNIGHLVRKKPRPELESESSERENVKRVCTEEDKKQ